MHSTRFPLLLLVLALVVGCTDALEPTPSLAEASAPVSSPPATRSPVLEALLHPMAETRTQAQLAQAACTKADGSWSCKKLPRPATFGATGGGAVCPLSLSVTNWYVDPQNISGCASDQNSCTQSACGTTGNGPCLTFNEIPAHRWQSNTPNFLCGLTSLTFDPIVNFLSAMSDSVADAVTIAPMGGDLEIVGPIGAVNQVQTGTLASVIAKNPTADQVLTATLGAGLIAGQLIVNATHPSYAWTNSNPSGNVWLISQPMTHMAQAEVDTWANGDTYTVYNPIRLVVNLLGRSTVLDFVSTNPGPTNFGSGVVQSVVMAESKVVGGISSGGNQEIFAENCDFPQTTLLSDPGAGGMGVVAGQYRGGNNMQGLLFISDDFLSTGLNLIPRGGSTMSQVWIQGTGGPSGNMIIAEDVGVTGYIAGNTSINIVPGGTLSYSGTAVSRFLNTTAPAGQVRLGGLISPQTTACALDVSGDPAIWHCGRTVTAANLDQTITLGGFDGNAYIRTCAVVKQ